MLCKAGKEHDMKFKGDLIILDPCSAVKSADDWQKCGWGADMGVLGFTAWLCLDEGADCCCAVKNTDTGEILGHFCTDSAVLVLLDFSELLTYHPDFRDHEKYPGTCAVIRGFDGEVTIENGCFIGRGNINFVTSDS